MRTQGVIRGSRARRGGALAALLATAVALVGCSASVDPHAGVGEDPFAGGRLVASATGARAGHGTVRVLAPAGGALPASVLRAFAAATGFEVREDTASEDALARGAAGRVDAVVGVDGGDAIRAGLAHASAYGRADVCVMADRQWFAANRITPPRTFGDLAQSRYSGLLVIPDPRASVAGRAFVQASAGDLGTLADAYWSSLLGAGRAAVVSPGDVNRRYSGHEAGAQRPLAVAPLTDAAKTLNTAKTESATAPVERTCLRRDLYAAPAPHAANVAGAASLVTFLRSGAGQRALARSGAVVPLDARSAAGTPVGRFARAVPGAVRVSGRDLASNTAGWVRAFEQARGR